MKLLLAQMVEDCLGVPQTAELDHEGQRVVTINNENDLRLWDANTGAPLPQAVTKHTPCIDLATWQAASNQLLIICRKEAYLISISDGEIKVTFTGHTDWRRDNRVSARKLQRLSHPWLKNWRQASGNDDAKLILIGHAMGGLVARYFLEVLGGWRNTRALITFGTPYRGSLNAVGYLANGYAKSIGPLSLDFSETLRSFTAVYQLLPAFECIDTGDGHLKRVSESGPLPNIDIARASEALKFYREMKAAQEANAQLDAYRSQGYEIYPIVGVQQPTFQSAECRAGKLSLLRTIKGKDESGDGTAPRLSATPIELTDAYRESYMAEAHASLQNWEAALVQLTAILTRQDINTNLFKFGRETAISLDLDDVYPAQAVKIRASVPNGIQLSAIVTDSAGTEKATVPLSPSEGDLWTATLSLPPGTYRVITKGDRLNPVTDVILAI